MTGLLTVPLWFAWNSRGASFGWFVRASLCAALPVVVVAFGLLAYNYARFGDVWEFGVKYQLNVDPSHLPHFAWANVAFNGWQYFLHFPGWSWRFPFAGPWRNGWPMPTTMAGIEHPVGLLTATPFLALSIGAVVFFRYWAAPLRALTVLVTSLAGANAAVLLAFFGCSSRYEIAFAPYLTFVAAVVVFSTEAATAARFGMARAAARGVWFAGFGFSVLYATLFAFRAHGESYFKRGLGRALAGDWSGAIVDFEAALHFDPDNWSARKFRAEGEFRLERDAAAAADLEAIVALEPEEGLAWNYLGVIASRTNGREREAVDCFQRCVRLTPKDPEAHYNLAVALLRIDSRAPALTELQYALKLDPRFDRARRALVLLGEHPDG